MTSSAPEVTTKKKRSLVLPIAVAVVAVAVGGYALSRAGLDKALVKDQVDAFIAQTQTRAKESGRDLAITYTDIEIAGGFTNRHAVLKEPTILVQPLADEAGEEPDTDRVRIRTDRLEIYPESVDLSTVRIAAPAPITFVDTAEEDKILLTITSTTAPSVTVTSRTQDEVSLSDIHYQAPAEMAFKYLKETHAEGEEDKPATLVPVYETLTVAMAQGSSVKATLAQPNNSPVRASIDLRELVMTPSQSPESALMAPEIKGEWSNTLNEKKRNVVTAVLNAGPIRSADADLPYQPVTIALDAAFEGVIPSTAEAIASASTEPSVMTIKTFKVETKESTFSATADFTAAATDPMPVGKATIALSNVPYVMGELRTTGMLDAQSEPLMGGLLSKISGQSMEELKDLSVVVERPKDGQFKVGNATFEELLSVFLAQVMKSQGPAGDQPPYVPQLPPASKPKAAPIAVPDQDTRG